MPTTDNDLVTSTLRPGFLIGLKTSVRGNVSYRKDVIEAEHRTRSGAEKAKWQTERTITDPEEFKKANQVRMKARGIILSVCAQSAFGALCPENKMDELKLAIAEAQREAKRFNNRATLTRVSVYVISGRIARDDVEAARAINSEVRDLLQTMSEGVKNLDVAVVRGAANRARNLGSMLSPEAADKLKGAVTTVRNAARKIVKAGETAAQEIDQEALRTLAQARTAFLDIDSGPEAEIATPDADAREIDLHPEGEDPAPVEADLPAAPARSGTRRQAAKKAAPKARGKKKAARKAPTLAGAAA
jgi:hypothetical protein